LARRSGGRALTDYVAQMQGAWFTFASFGRREHPELLANNEAYAGSFDKGDLPLPPARKVAVIACMDARLNVYGALGLTEGEAHVIRNAGGVVTDDEIRTEWAAESFPDLETDVRQSIARINAPNYPIIGDADFNVRQAVRDAARSHLGRGEGADPRR
jgi:hypothetical protein